MVPKVMTQTFYSVGSSTNNELVEASFECMRKFISGFTVDTETVNTLVRMKFYTFISCQSAESKSSSPCRVPVKFCKWIAKNLGCVVSWSFIFQMRNIIGSLSDYRIMNINLITRMSYLAQIFPGPFTGNDKILEQLLGAQNLLKLQPTAELLPLKFYTSSSLKIIYTLPVNL